MTRAAWSLVTVFVSSLMLCKPAMPADEKELPPQLKVGSTWIGKAYISTDKAMRNSQEQPVAMRIERIESQSIRATIWPTDAFLLHLEGELTKENTLQLRVVQVSRPKDAPQLGPLWQKGIMFQGRLADDKIEGTIRWPPREDGLVLQGKFILRLVK